MQAHYICVCLFALCSFKFSLFFRGYDLAHDGLSNINVFLNI